MPKDTKTLGNNKARACESLGFVHKKGCASVLTQPHFYFSYADKRLYQVSDPLFAVARKEVDDGTSTMV